MAGNVRPAARAVILSPEDRVLLICMEEPKSGINIWITHGRGINPAKNQSIVFPLMSAFKK